MPYRILGLSCVTVVVLSFSPAWGVSQPKPNSVQENIQRLLKSKSCPSCDLSGADLSQSRLAKSDLSGANLMGANLNLADLSGANRQKANLDQADLSGADLSFADLEGAILRGTNLKGAHFQQTKIKGRTVNRLIHADNAQAEAGADTVTEEQLLEPTPELTSTTSSSAVDPKPAANENEALNHLPPPAAGEAGATETSAQAVEAANDVSDARQVMLEKMFDQERCIGCNLSGLDLSDRNMGGFDLERADFTGSNLKDADLSNANLKGALFRNCLMQEADLSDADLYRADFTGADLTDAQFDDAKSDGADFSGAIGLKPAETEDAQ